MSYQLIHSVSSSAALNDVVRAVRWSIEGGLPTGIRGDRILLSGASAGANLALGAALKMRDEDGFTPLGLALFYGVYGDDFDTDSYMVFGSGEVGLSRQGMKKYFDDYLPTVEARQDPYAVPLKANLGNVPPVWLGVAELDVLRDDSRRLCDKLNSEGSKVEIVEYAGMIHGFCNRARMVPTARTAIADGGRFLASMAAR